MTKKNDKEDPAWVEVTPETVTPPAYLLRVANLVYNTMRAYEPTKDPRLKAIEEALDWGTYPDYRKAPYDALELLKAPPSREILEARINYCKHEMQAGRVDHLSGNIPAFFSGTLLTVGEVSRNTGIPEDELLRQADSCYSRFITDPAEEDFDSDEPPRFYSEQFNPDGTLNERKGKYIQEAVEYYSEEESFYGDVFMPQMILGYVSPVSYAALSDEHLEACKETLRVYQVLLGAFEGDYDDDLFF